VRTVVGAAVTRQTRTGVFLALQIRNVFYIGLYASVMCQQSVVALSGFLELNVVYWRWTIEGVERSQAYAAVLL